MTQRHLIISAWLALTAAVIIWLFVGNLPTEYMILVGFLAAMSLSFGTARLIALQRLAREDPVEPRMVPLRISGAILGLVTFGPLIAAAAGAIDIIPASASFALGIVSAPIIAALFSDGYQGLWIDALVFFGRTTPPEEDWILKKR